MNDFFVRDHEPQVMISAWKALSFHDHRDLAGCCDLDGAPEIVTVAGQ